MNTSAVLVLVPNDDYKTIVHDPHLTLGYFGKAADLLEWQIKVMKGVAEEVSEFMHKPYWTKKPKANGRIIFNIAPEHNDGNRFCYADQIDQNALPRVRNLVEDKLGFGLDRQHGFTPHMTVAYSDFWSPDLARPTPMQVFTWKSVELWIAGEHFVYPFDKSLPAI